MVRRRAKAESEAPVADAPRGRQQTHKPSVYSILAADFGSVNTRVILFDLVDGQYRLISRAQTLTTDSPPIGDVGVGLRRAVRQMSELIGRTLLRDEELIIGNMRDGSGVELFVATASSGRPMKAALVGLTDDISLASGKRALASTYIELVATLSVSNVRDVEGQLNTLLHAHPDVILMVGGTNNGAMDAMRELLKTVKLAVLMTREQKPLIIYAGNEAMKAEVQAALESETQVFPTFNLRPTVDEEDLATVALELAIAYGNYKAIGAGGFGEVQQLSRLGVLPTVQSYANIIRYLGELPGAGRGVMCVDVGSSSVTVCASIDKQMVINIRPDLGVGHSAVSGVEKVGAANVLRWLTFDANEADIIDYAWNKSLRPSTVPQSPKDLEIEYALTRELIRAAVQESRDARGAWKNVPRGETLPPLRPIIGSGSILAQPINPGVGAMLLLDALQPTGITELKLDPYGLIPALGGLAYIEPVAAVQILDLGGLVNLGTAISPDGRANGASEITIRYASGRTIKSTVAPGTLRTFALPSGQKAQVSLRLARGLTVNGRGRVSLELEGGLAGIIFDARGRPFRPPKELAKRAELIPAWYAAAAGK
jgi:hypothetical protein